MCTAEVLGGSPEGLSLWQRTDLRTVWDPQKAGWIHALGMADAQGSQLLFFLPRAVDEAIPEAMRGRVLSWNVQRGEEGRVLFFGCRVWFSFEDGAATSSFVGSYCWCCALVGSEAQPTVVTRPRGGGVHVHPLPPTSRHSPQALRNLREGGLHDENLLVGASPVVDYFAFVLENLANSALHRVLGRFGEAVGSKTRRSCFK